jgi:hypothetical protein
MPEAIQPSPHPAFTRAPGRSTCSGDRRLPATVCVTLSGELDLAGVPAHRESNRSRPSPTP